MAVTGDVYNTRLLKRIFKYVKPYRAVFVWSVILTILLAAISPVRPFLIKYTLDHYILAGNYSGLVNMAMLMVFMLVLQTLIQYNHTLLTNTLGQSVIRDLRINVLDGREGKKGIELHACRNMRLQCFAGSRDLRRLSAARRG